MEDYLDALDRKVIAEMNKKILVELSVEEISTAMHDMPAMKAPGPDGFSGCFYQSNWVMIHNEVCSAVNHFFQTGILDEGINTTHIALIPKVHRPVHVSEFANKFM